MLTCTFENGSQASLRHVTVDAILIRDEKVLLVRRAEGMLEGGKWALCGGYVERDETLREALAREVLEESGYNIKNIKLLTIRDNPDRPHEDRQNISFVFACEAGEKIGESDAEVSEQKWFELSQLPEDSQIAFDHKENLEVFKTEYQD